MGDSTGEIREELAEQRRDAEQKIQSLRLRTARTARQLAPLVGAGVIGAMLLGAGLAAGVVLVGRRRRTVSDRALQGLRELGGVLKTSIPRVHIQIDGNSSPRPDEALWLRILLRVSEAGAGAGATALVTRLLRGTQRT